MGPDCATMAVNFGKQNMGIQGQGGEKRKKKEGDANKDTDEQERFQKATEQVTNCKGKNIIRHETRDILTTATMEARGQESPKEENMTGLEPPRLNKGDHPVVGEDINRLRIENKQRKRERKALQQPYSQWKVHKGEGTLRNRKQEGRQQKDVPKCNVSYRTSVRASCCPVATGVRRYRLPSQDRETMDKRNDGGGSAMGATSVGTNTRGIRTFRSGSQGKGSKRTGKISIME